MLTPLGELLAAVLAWWRTPRDGARSYEHDVGGGYVFCEFCRDWHPPGNCAGEWP